ncbi:MAG TPA: outer membrane protein [Methylocella sp.]|nr:outer membrane protein [Methylocella sp.]
MRKLLLSAAVATLIVGPASAADLAVKAPPLAPAYITSPWDGLYIGGNLGYGDTNFDVTASGFGTLASEHANGVVGGFQVGYNKQIGTFVLGLETDFDLTSIEKTTFGVTTKLPWFGTTRGRLGFLLNPSLLLYGTGGVAYGHAEVSVPRVSVTIPGVGWAAGAGLQYALTPQWSIGAEYLHVELDGPSVSAGGISIDTKATTDLGRATLNYKF